MLAPMRSARAETSAESPRAAASTGRTGGLVRGLLGACHLGPSLAVTVITGLLAAAAGASVARTGLVSVTVLVGQLSVGWSNDWIDAGRDAAVTRADKPVATGLVTRSQVAGAALIAVAATVPLSFTLGASAGALHLLAVLSAWSYNLGLKATVWSWLPYAVTFGSLPSIVTLALPERTLAPWWAMAAGALLGIGAHLVNTLPDLDEDHATGIRGLPHRLGATATGILAPVVLVVATLFVVLGPPGGVAVFEWAALTGNTVVASFGAAVAGRSRQYGGRRGLSLLATVVVAIVTVVLLLVSGTALVP